MKLTSLLKFIIAVTVSELAGVIGSLFTISTIPTWYAALTKPAFNPPSWVFGPVWITLYLLMGIATFIVWNKGWNHNGVHKALGIFVLQLALNVTWSITFFGLHSPLWAYIDIIVLWLSIAWTMILFYNISKPAFWLLAPYILWVSFAAYLNYSIVMLN